MFNVIQIIINLCYELCFVKKQLITLAGLIYKNLLEGRVKLSLRLKGEIQDFFFNHFHQHYEIFFLSFSENNI